MTPSCTGTIIVTTTISISTRLPPNRSFANANPAMALVRTTANAIALATIAEFMSAVQKSILTTPELKSREMLCQRCEPGVSTGGYAAIVELSWDATTSDQ